MTARTTFTKLLACAVAATALLMAATTADAAGGGPTASAAADTPSFRLTIAGVYRLGNGAYVLPKARLDVRGAVKADALAGQRVNLEVYRHGKLVKRRSVKLNESGDKAIFRTVWRAGSKGSYRLKVGLTNEQKALADEGHTAKATVTSSKIHRGSRGASVRIVQYKLRRLHYVVPVNGVFDAATARALMAFRKVTGMSRNYTAGSGVLRKLAAGQGAFRLRFPNAGRHVEVSISRQVMAFANKGRVLRIYHVSTGKASTPTIRGTYRVYRKDWGTNAKGMVHSSYFIRGYAVHGYADVPPYPASHGCVRVPVPSAASIFRWIRYGTRVDTY